MDRFEALPLPQKLVIIFLVLAAAAGGYYFLVIADSEEAIASEQQKLRETETLLSQMTPKYGNRDAIRKAEESLTQVAEELEQYKAMLPSEDQIPTLITSIKRQADERGLRIIRFKKLERQMDDYVAAVPVEMEVEGSFPVIISFLEALAQAGMRMMTVNEIEIRELPMKRFLKDGPGSKISEADRIMAESGVGRNLGGRSSAPTDPAQQLIAELDAYQEAIGRYQVSARFTVNAYSYSGRVLNDSERKKRKRTRQRRR